MNPPRDDDITDCEARPRIRAASSDGHYRAGLQFAGMKGHTRGGHRQPDSDYPRRYAHRAHEAIQTAAQVRSDGRQLWLEGRYEEDVRGSGQRGGS